VSATRISVVALGSLLFLAGCYGSTEPASDVGPHTAKLHARGTANDGPAYSYFEYGPILGPTSTTPRRQWPAGASGPFSEALTGLEESTDYQFNVCGGDQGEGAVCAQRRYFQTPGPAGKDSVKGRIHMLPELRDLQGDIDALSGPAGENPSGSLSYTVRVSNEQGITQRHFVGFVTCLQVDGNRAAVGAVGVTNLSGEPEEPASGLMTVVDGTPGNEADRFGTQTTAGGAAPDCSTAPEPTTQGGLGLVVVTDEP
jgi:hypothetical protein